MTFNSQVIIQDIRMDFEKMPDYVTGEQARTATADATERGLFKMLIEMGLKLLGWKQGLLRLRIAFVFFYPFCQCWTGNWIIDRNCCKNRSAYASERGI